MRPIAAMPALAHAASMTVRNFLNVAAVALLLPLLCSNRAVPEWRASRNTTLSLTERCVSAELRRFGQVRVERGNKPEAGKVRLFLLRQQGGKNHSVATIYMDGFDRFSALWMDATSKRLGDAIWNNAKRRCGLR